MASSQPTIILRFLRGIRGGPTSAGVRGGGGELHGLARGVGLRGIVFHLQLSLGNRQPNLRRL